ncbi:toll-like receptor 2 [Lingula anatina]|uniref:Toll-like receptor 2 n=1 Tax=Lingula anatina TaxID=7574 RepID=A0A1S3H9Y4_LINAN|nr:toll-like receptor 2 [Lingula anatina]|eukprot:XP_013382818.1 toll-like receptor 2 [Lingula anatina]
MGMISIWGVVVKRLMYSKVEVLDLPHCQINIAELNSSVLRPLSNSSLRELRLSGNNIAAVASDIFQALPVIEKLDLSFCKIRTFRASFKTLSSTLRELDISMNGISDLELFKSVALSFPNLRKLVAQHNEFMAVKTINYPPHQHLNVLDLSFNRLYGYLNFTRLTNLRELYLNGLFGSLPSPYTHPGLHLFIVQNMTSLVTFQYTHNKACVLRNHLNFSAFEGLSSIRKIDLTGNAVFCMMKIGVLPQIFKSQVPLRRLILASNSISKLPNNMFSHLPHLEYLDLSDNHMENVDTVFDSLTSLVFLNLRKNKLVTIDIGSILGTNPRLHFLNIELNRFSCSCDSSSFSEWLRHTTTKVYGARQKCSEPAEYQNTALEDFNPPWITCGNHLITVVFCCIGAGVLIIGAVAGLVAYFRLDIVYWWHLRRLNRRRHGYIRCGDRQEQYEYDAFVAHNSRDEAWVVRQFLPHVEGQGQGRNMLQGQGQGQGYEQGRDIFFNVCIHSRNFLPGDYIIDSIVEKMEASKAVILIISQHFLQSDWCRYEIDIAQAKVLRERRKSLIVVFLERIPPDQLPKTLRLMKRHVTYLEWPEEENDGKREEFWKKLKLALLKRTRQIDEALDVDEAQM